MYSVEHLRSLKTTELPRKSRSIFKLPVLPRALCAPEDVKILCLQPCRDMTQDSGVWVPCCLASECRLERQEGGEKGATSNQESREGTPKEKAWDLGHSEEGRVGQRGTSGVVSLPSCAFHKDSLGLSCQNETVRNQIAHSYPAWSRTSSPHQWVSYTCSLFNKTVLQACHCFVLPGLAASPGTSENGLVHAEFPAASLRTQSLELGSETTLQIPWMALSHQEPWKICVVVQTVKNLPARQEIWIQSLGGKIPWRRAWQPTPVFLPGESHGQRSLVGYHPRGHRVGHNWATNTFPFIARLGRQVREPCPSSLVGLCPWSSPLSLDRYSGHVPWRWALLSRISTLQKTSIRVVFIHVLAWQQSASQS